MSGVLSLAEESATRFKADGGTTVDAMLDVFGSA